jgi:hypothetical protein
MSSSYTVICHRCGKPTFVDLSRTISDQRCRSCRGFLQGVDVRIGDRDPEMRRKLVVKLSGTAGREPVWQDEAAAVIPLRHRWPRFFRWVIWCSLIVILGIVVRIIQVQFQDDPLAKHKPPRRQEETVKVGVRSTPEWVEKATLVAKKALAAKTTDELLPHLYHPDVNEDVIRKYYTTEETLPLGSDLNEYEYVIPDGYKENVAAFSFTDTAGRNRYFVVVEKKDGMKIDWPSFVGLGEMSLKEYVRSMPPGVVVMRARARLGEYYNNYFADSKRWLSVRLCDVTDDNEVYAYYDRELPGSAELAEALPDPSAKVKRPDVPVIVVLKQPKGNIHADQAQIVAFISSTWYHEEGLSQIIEHARKLDEVRNALSGDTPAPETPAPQKTGVPPISPP